METTTALVATATTTQDHNNVNFNQVPLVALRHKTRLILSSSLNIQKILSSEENLPRDWRGIAHLAGIGSYRLDISNHADPMAKVLQLWKAEGDKGTTTFYHLRNFLERIDRFDVLDDINEYLVDDVEYFTSSKVQEGQQLQQQQQQQQQQITQEVAKQKDSEITKRDDNILTHDDVERSHQGLPPQLYDAFVLFADEDIDFAAELITRMENFGFKLCVKERDLIGGVSFEHEAILRLISERCNRLIVIVSPAFLQSPANSFFVNFAQALGIEQGRRKIVPCLYQKCDLPPTLNFYFLLNYQRSEKWGNFWDKLKDSIRSTPGERVAQVYLPRVTITEVESSQCAITNNTIVNSTNLQITAPIKIPRKRRCKSNSPLQTPDYSSDVNVEFLNSSSSVPGNKIENSNASILHPLSKEDATSTHSMLNLNQLQLNNSTLANHNISSSSLTLTSTSNSSTHKEDKKTRWYKQFFKSRPLSLLDSKKQEKSPKRKLFGKKIAISS